MKFPPDMQVPFMDAPADAKLLPPCSISGLQGTTTRKHTHTHHDKVMVVTKGKT